MNRITRAWPIVTVLALLWLLPGSGRAQESQDATSAREPGVSLRVYDVGKKMVALPKLVEGQTPNINRRIETIDLAGVRVDSAFAVLIPQTPAGEGMFRLRNETRETDTIELPFTVEGDE